MSPRPYRITNRKVATDATRARIVAGARELLLSEDGFRHFTMDAIARESGVARMTVYYQFQSKSGIFEALADDIAARGKVAENMAHAFEAADAREAIVRFISAFVHFWMADSHAMRKLHALSVLDPESRAEERNTLKRGAAERLIRRLHAEQGVPEEQGIRAAADGLAMLTGFSSTYDLVELGYSEPDIVALLCAMAGKVLDCTLTI